MSFHLQWLVWAWLSQDLLSPLGFPYRLQGPKHEGHLLSSKVHEQGAASEVEQST